VLANSYIKISKSDLHHSVIWIEVSFYNEFINQTNILIQRQAQNFAQRHVKQAILYLNLEWPRDLDLSFRPSNRSLI